jgi:hypothetical protein
MSLLYSCPALVLALWDLSVGMKIVVFSVVCFTDSPLLNVPLCTTVALLENRHIFTGRECRQFLIFSFFLMLKDVEIFVMWWVKDCLFSITLCC